MFSLLPAFSVNAQGTTPYEEPESGAVVCPPGVYFDSPGDCLPAGPSEYLTQMGRLGLNIPRALCRESSQIRR